MPHSTKKSKKKKQNNKRRQRGSQSPPPAEQRDLENAYNDKKICSLQLVSRSCADPDISVDRLNAKNCALGFWKIWPFLYLNTKSAICGDLLMRHPDYAIKLTVDQSLNHFLKTILKRPDLSFTNYKGYIQYAFLGLIYLIERNPDECVVISNFQNTLEKMKRELTTDDGYSLRTIDWSDIGVLWQYDEKSGKFRISYPGNRIKFVSAARQCMKRKKSRFILVIGTLEFKGTCHANIIIYDKINHELERFDPYQVTPALYGTNALDLKLQQTFKEIDPDFRRQVVSPNPTFFLEQGLQLKQESEEEKSDKDPIGFCQPWTILYAETRMRYPSQSPDNIVRHFEDTVLTSEDQSLTKFIRKYAQRIHELNQMTLLDFQRSVSDKGLNSADPRVSLLMMYINKMSTFKQIYS